MSHVFISYARADEPLARDIGDALREAGYEVWRDDELPAHRPYAEIIEERIKGAAAVVVLWSAEAARSQWVRAEADTARAALTLVQATLDGIIPPLPFNQIQCAQLKDWDGQRTHHGWSKLIASVAELAGPKSKPEASPRPSSRSVSICVLPFQNMSGDAEQEYFSDGISEDITTDLSKISALEVIARNTAFTFKGQSVNVCDVAAKLGVTHVLEGSVRKVGDKVRINAQLIDGRTCGHVWAERFDRDLTDIFTIQDEISKAIVSALKLKLHPEEKKAIHQRGTANPEAYDLYLLARQYWVTGNIGDQRREERVMRICGRAVEIDPYYAAAWALLAMAQSNLRYAFRCQVDDGYAAAHSALTIDASIAEAHLPMLRRLEERQLYAEADAEMETALRLDPDSWEVNKEAARVLMRQRRLEEAATHLEKAVSLMQSDVHAWARLVTLHHALGNRAAAKVAAETTITQAEHVLAQDPSNGAAISFGAGAYAALGNGERAREWMDRAMLVDPDNLSMRYNFACTLAAFMDDKEAALSHLERSLATAGAFHLNLAEADPDLDSLRGEPRFESIMARARERLGVERPTFLEPSAATIIGQQAPAQAT